MFKSKKQFIAALFALFAASCSEEVEMTSGNDGMTSFSIDIEGQVATRAVGDASNVNQLAWRVYDASGNCLTTLNGSQTATFPAVVNLDLVKGQTYTVAFWAQSAACEAYSLDYEGKVTIDYDKLTNNNENADAFFGATVFTVVPNGSTSQAITLRRALAQVNVGVTQADFEHAQALGIEIASSKVTINNVATTLNIYNGNVGDAKTVTLANAALSAGSEKLVVNGKNYNYLSSGYFLVNDPTAGNVDTETMQVKAGGEARAIATSIDFVFTPTEGTPIEFGWTNVPVQRNYRTNFIGRILTGDIQTNVDLDTNWSDDYEVYSPWDGSTISEVKEVNGVYTVSNGAELAWIAKSVNEKKNLFNGKKVVLSDDIYLANAKWEPIGQTGKGTFAGEFDGQGHTIYGLNTSKIGQGEYVVAGLFGWIESVATIKNFTIDGAKVASSHYAGVVAAYLGAHGGKATISDVTVKNAKVSCVYYGTDQEGDKAGIIAGYLNPGVADVINCSAVDCTVDAVRDAGQLVGCAYYTNTVSGSAENVAVTVNATAPESYTRTGEFVRNEFVGKLIKKQLSDDVVVIEGNTISIKDAQGMLWLAQKVNDNNETLKAYTVVLTDDVDLQGIDWAAIGSVNSYPSKTFAGTFDGQNHTISNLNVTVLGDGGNASAGLFGSITGVVQNLNVDKAKVVSSHYAGVICGYSSANVGMKISGCHITNSTVISAPELVGSSYDNGDKAGGIIGYMVAGDVVTGCTVANTTIQAYRDLGAIVGMSAGEVSNCKVLNNVTVKVDDAHNYKGYTKATEFNADHIVGRKGGTITGCEGAAELIIPGAIWSGDKYYSSIADVITDANQDEQIEIELPKGTFTIPTAAKGKTLNFIGTGKNETVIECKGIGNENLYASKITFENLTIETDNATYRGFTHVSGATFKDCIIKNQLTLYNDGTEPLTFDGCTFEVSDDNYNLWTWGASATFTNCTFNCDGKAALVYGGTPESTVTFDNCTFNDKGDINGKAAIETGDDYSSKYNIHINNCTVNGFDVTTPKKDYGGDNIGTNVWGNKDRMPKDRLNVYINNEEVY